MGHGEYLPGITMKNDDTQSRAKTLKREPILVKLIHWGRGLRIYMVKGEHWGRNGKARGYFWFSAKNFGGITICKSRDICWFKNAIPQISPSQTFPDFCDLLNGRLALSRRLNKQAFSLSFNYIEKPASYDKCWDLILHKQYKLFQNLSP